MFTSKKSTLDSARVPASLLALSWRFDFSRTLHLIALGLEFRVEVDLVPWRQLPRRAIGLLAVMVAVCQ
jgi:hypothetical protein